MTVDDETSESETSESGIEPGLRLNAGAPLLFCMYSAAGEVAAKGLPGDNSSDSPTTQEEDSAPAVEATRSSMRTLV